MTQGLFKGQSKIRRITLRYELNDHQNDGIEHLCKSVRKKKMNQALVEALRVGSLVILSNGKVNLPEGVSASEAENSYEPEGP